MANLSGLERAFQQITSQPISISANALQPNTPLTYDFSRCNAAWWRGKSGIYTVCVRISRERSARCLGKVSPPVWLWHPIAPGAADDRKPADYRGYCKPDLESESGVAGLIATAYRQITDPNAADDEWSMTLVAEVMADDAANPYDLSLAASVQIPRGKVSWFCITAVSNFPTLGSLFPSAPSGPISAMPQNNTAPVPPGNISASRSTGAKRSPSQHLIHARDGSDDLLPASPAADPITAHLFRSQAGSRTPLRRRPSPRSFHPRRPM